MHIVIATFSELQHWPHDGRDGDPVSCGIPWVPEGSEPDRNNGTGIPPGASVLLATDIIAGVVPPDVRAGEQGPGSAGRGSSVQV